MALPNHEFARTVREALQGMGWSPEEASEALGIKLQTMNAMCSGIVPMRSLVIRFASELGRRIEERTDVPEWWRDVDAWLAVGGYPPRRDLLPGRPGRGAGIRIEPLPRGAEGGDRGAAHPPADGPPGGSEVDPAAGEPASQYYRPIYERLPWGESCVHIFWLLNRNDEKTHQFRFPGPVDYRRRATQLKNDLCSMTKASFERRYARYRLDEEP